jgi:DNA repair protein RecO (recombination protein O)
VSPKSGRAVSNEGAKGYEHLLLKLPSFILNETEPKDSSEIEQALDLSEYFFERYIWRQRNNMDVKNGRNVLKSLLQ